VIVPSLGEGKKKEGKEKKRRENSNLRDL